jgi:hypothetical protein
MSSHPLFLHSKAAVLPRSPSNSSRSMRQRRLPFLQWRSGANALRNGELRDTTTQDVKGPLRTTHPKPFPLCWRRAQTFDEGFSAGTSALEMGLACEFFMIRSAWKVQSLLGSPYPGHSQIPCLQRLHSILIRSLLKACSGSSFFGWRD